VRLVEQWRRIVSELPEGWGDARLLLTVDDEGRAARSAGLLAPLQAGRSGNQVRFFCARVGPGPRPDTVERLLRRLDRERITGTLERAAVSEAAKEAARPEERPALAPSWDAALQGLPPDWTDVYAETRFRSTDQLDRAALLMAPLNPARFDPTPAFRFRCARQFGYGASPAMVRRCLERLDADGIRAEVRIVHALSDTEPVATQGPVWYIGGRPV
jgi:hypothetical protein